MTKDPTIEHPVAPPTVSTAVAPSGLPLVPPVAPPVAPSRQASAHVSDEAARTDAELLKASREDPAAFRQFYDRWSEPVLGYLQRRLDDPQVALDLTAETFAVVFEKRASYKWKGTSPGAWVFGIAKNLLRRYFRTQAIQRRAVDRLGVQLPAYDDQSLRRVEDLVDNAEMRALVQSKLASAKDADRAVLELRFVQGLPFTDVAHALGCSVNTARVRCHRALTRLEKQLSAEHPTLAGGEGARS